MDTAGGISDNVLYRRRSRRFRSFASVDHRSYICRHKCFKGACMVQRRQRERSLFEVLLPDGHKLWPDWLRRIDALLEDEAVIEVVAQGLEARWPQSRRRGRPGTPAEVVIRMLMLKHLFDLTTPAATRLGVILGTAAYMNPEQARGKPVDRRADIWAFGCVLYEMLAGKRAFAGDDVSDTLAFILTKEPDWRALPTNAPAPVQRLMRRCLEKDRKRRLADVADARLEIDEWESRFGLGSTASNSWRL
jgi:serine/threonine protein kinase